MNAVARAVDDCWNRIGVQGDATCAELQAHIHCRNCQVYSAAARRLLDVPLPEDHLRQWTEHFAAPRREPEHNEESVLIFRCGDEWLAVPTGLCAEVTAHRTIHTLPHRRNPAVLGLTNIRGELVVCLSLSTLLGTSTTSARRDDAPLRLLVLLADPTPVAVQVEEVHGTHRFNPRDLVCVPDTLASNAARRTRGTLRWRERTVGVLDARPLLDSINRSLA